MLNIDEIEGGLDDDFRDLLESFDDDRLKRLLANSVALTQLRPASITSRRARAMTRAVLEARAHPPETIPDEVKRVKRRKPARPAPAPLTRPAPPPQVDEIRDEERRSDATSGVPVETPLAVDSAPLPHPPPAEPGAAAKFLFVLLAILALAGILALLL